MESADTVDGTWAMGFLNYNHPTLIVWCLYTGPPRGRPFRARLNRAVDL